MVPPSPTEPSDIESAIRDALSGGPLSKTEIARRVKPLYRGGKLDALLGRLVADQKIFAHRKASKRGVLSKAIAAYSLEPAPPPPAAAFLSGVAHGLRAAVNKARARGVSDAALLDELVAMLGLKAQAPAAPDTTMDAEMTLRELRELSRQEPSGTLIPVRRLRGRSPLDKSRFDAAVLELARAEHVILHHHDLPERLGAEERQALVVDRHGTHYVGIALRTSS
jgi:hypothetical protein